MTASSTTTRPPANGQSAADEKTILLLKPRGFCAGVVRAIDVVRIALEAFAPPIYLRKDIVHNSFEVDEFRGKGAIFLDTQTKLPTPDRLTPPPHHLSPHTHAT